jgi:hypothetical protein
MMMKRRFGIGLAALLLAEGVAQACGASFGSNIKVDPHQDIIVVWKDGVETYAFQPTFCGSSSDFGLILPVSAMLSQNPTLIEQQAFATAAALSEPNKRQVVVHQGAGCGGAFSAGGSKSMVDEPTVVASGRVGMLDWTALKAQTESSFTDWLDANGYPHSPAASNVFAYYVQKGWYFLAFRISQEAVQGGGVVCRSLGPVALSFPTPAPVIPSAMASADNPSTGDQVSWRIFGITHGDVQLTFANANSYDKILWYSGAIAGVDLASFAGLATAGDRLTRLALIYTKADAQDVELKLDPAQDYRGTQDVMVYEDTACSLGPGRDSAPSALAWLCGLALLGRLFWRRAR